MQLRYVCSLVLCSWVIIGCSIDTQPCNKVDQDGIYQSLVARYDKEDDETSVTATLRFGGPTGTTLEMVENCSISHSQYSLGESALAELLGTSYVGSGDGELLNHTFTFVDNDNNTFVNNVNLVPIEFASTVGTITKASGVTITWTGAAKGTNEIIYFYVRDYDQSATRTVSYSSSSTTGNSITVPSSTFDNISTGTGKEIWLVRTFVDNVAQGSTEGGFITGSYETSHQTVTIE